MQHVKQHHHLEHDTVVALVAGPVAAVAFAVMAILLKDAPVAHAAHAAITGR